ncbi:kinase-like domain-containing protein [Jimgerdemannia flammicorona]|uniref:Kinase-like domain-containing protein n=1 Tax=Jimgerdemannia flammicorona TaxID=994334 RepID=A0A433D5H8_9FUNG|nr:kinase-like domain-containing protein [Jimgerdemannia flammicorona]
MASQESAQYSSQYSSQSSYLFSQRTVLLPDNDVLSQSQQLPNERPIIGHLLGMKDKKRFGVDIYADSPLIFGRHKSCDVVVKSEFISNNHCRIYTHQVDFGSVEDILVFCEDTSLNGTWWNGRIIGKGNSVVLCHGDRLRVSKGMDLTYQQIAKSKEIQDPEDYRVVEMEYQITSKRLGAGAFAEVRMALCKRTREQLAVKIMDKNRLHMSQMNGTDFAREVEILKKVNHPNIVRVHDVIETERYIYIFLQMVTGGDLFDYVKSCGKIPEEEAKYLFFQVLQAIEYLHDHDISHRDTA